MKTIPRVCETCGLKSIEQQAKVIERQAKRIVELEAQLAAEVNGRIKFHNATDDVAEILELLAKYLNEVEDGVAHGRTETITVPVSKKG